LFEFFQQRGQRSEVGMALGAWSGMLAAPTWSGFHIPWGAPTLTPAPRGTSVVVACQLAAITVAFVIARRNRQRFLQLMAALLATAAGIALLSIVRIPGRISDYQVFWLSGIGALMWGTFAAVLARIPSRPRPSFGPAAAFTIMAAVLVAGASVRALYDARKYAIDQQFEDVRRRDAARAVRQVIAGRQLRRPLIATTLDVWNDATSIVLDAYKHYANLAVDADLVRVFGDPLAANGREDAEIVIAGPRLQTEIAQRPGTVTIFSEDGLFVDVRAIAPRGAIIPKPAP
ncbi:MAG TPA: hypothetical protein VFZ98_00620, partial [Vicinamibacterales bacterium]